MDFEDKDYDFEHMARACCSSDGAWELSYIVLSGVGARSAREASIYMIMYMHT